MDSNNAVSLEIEEDTVSFREHQDKVRENLGICITIFGIVFVAVVVTTIKIIMFDKETYPSVFYTPEEILAMKNNSTVREGFIRKKNKLKSLKVAQSKDDDGGGMVV